MQSALALALVVLVSCMLLLPPIAFALSFARYHRRSNPRAGLVTRGLWFVAALAPALLNVGYLAYAWPKLSEGLLALDTNLGIAVMIAWVAFWARVALGRRGQRRKARRG